jgi:6-phosphofructokinase 1
MPMGGKFLDMTQVAVENARKQHIDCLVCLGGGGTQKWAWRLVTEGGLNVLTLPKTIDNDVVETDVSFGYDTAMTIATEAVDRLHTTATSHHRIIVCEVMGHKAGWLALGAGLAGGADVILIPELPYRLELIGEFLRERRRSGKRFSIVVVAEGAKSVTETKAAGKQRKRAPKSKRGSKKAKQTLNNENGWADETRNGLPVVVRRVADEVIAYHVVQEPMASRIARQLQDLTGTEARVTSLGHVQRGGVPTPFDRMLCTRLGTRAAELLAEGVYNVMVAYRDGQCVPVPLERVAGLRKTIPPDHPTVTSARLVGTCLGDG